MKFFDVVYRTESTCFRQYTYGHFVCARVSMLVIFTLVCLWLFCCFRVAFLKLSFLLLGLA